MVVCHKRTPDAAQIPEVRENAPQRRAAQGFAGAAVEIDLIHKGIMTNSNNY